MEEQQARDSPASQTWPDVDVDVDAAADADVGCGCHTGQCGASSAATPAATPNFLPLSLSFSFFLQLLLPSSLFFLSRFLPFSVSLS